MGKKSRTKATKKTDEAPVETGQGKIDDVARPGEFVGSLRWDASTKV